MPDLTKSLHLTSCNVASALFDQQTYAEYLEFQFQITLPRARDKYPSKELWIAARDTVKGLSRGHLPGLPGYRAFMHWLSLNGKLFTAHEAPTTTKLKIAKACGHALHPAITSHFNEDTACPVCTIEQITSALHRAWRVWRALGGPTHGPPFEPYGLPGSLYPILRGIWRFEKVRWLEAVAQCEELSNDEIAWEVNEMLRVVGSSEYTLKELEEAKSAREAFKIACKTDPHRKVDPDVPSVQRPLLKRRAYTYPGPAVKTTKHDSQGPSNKQSVIKPLPPLGKPSSKSHLTAPLQLAQSYTLISRRCASASSLTTSALPPRVKKVVRFSADAMNNEKRALAGFKRNCASYVPGRYACPSKSGWADTSFQADKTFKYDHELEELTEKARPFSGLFAPRKYDTDPTIDEDDTSESDSDSSDDSSDGGAEGDPATEKDESNDALVVDIKRALGMQGDSTGEPDCMEGVQQEEALGDQELQSPDDVEMHGALNGYADAEVESSISSDGVSPTPEAAEQGSHMLEAVASPEDTILEDAPNVPDSEVTEDETQTNEVRGASGEVVDTVQAELGQGTSVE